MTLCQVSSICLRNETLMMVFWSYLILKLLILKDFCLFSSGCKRVPFLVTCVLFVHLRLYMILWNLFLSVLLRCSMTWILSILICRNSLLLILICRSICSHVLLELCSVLWAILLVSEICFLVVVCDRILWMFWSLDTWRVHIGILFLWSICRTWPFACSDLS